MFKIIQWDEKFAKKHLKTLLQDAMEYRKAFERQWRKNEGTIFHHDGMLSEGQVEPGAVNVEDLATFLDLDDPDAIGVNYTFKNYRFIHAQMSSNPPTVIVRPTSADTEDRRRADAADRLVRHAIRQYKMPERVDQVTAKTLLYGTGFMKTVWDSDAGDMIGINERTGEVHMEGDIFLEACSTWDIYVDPLAKCWDDVRFIIERKWMTREEARSKYPKHFKTILQKSEKFPRAQMRHSFKGRHRLEEQPVQIYCYWEKGMPLNGMGGRYVEFLEDGTLIGDIHKNPFAFRDRGEDEKEIPTAYLPFHILTDIDVADQVYGKSFIDYDAEIQDVVNRLDTLYLDNVRSHGNFRMVLPQGAEIMEDSLTDSPKEIIKITGNQGPHFVSPPQSPPDMSALRDRLQAGIDTMAGVNESMFGEQSRETSGFSMQYATNQGNMIRRRLFNKYVAFVESIYKGYLNLIRRHWRVPKTVEVLGKEKAFESLEIKGADINDGFDIVVEYGASLSLDPTSRRDEIMQLMPIFEKYGVDGKTIVRMLKLNELEGLYDINDMGRERQTEIFDEIMDGGGDVYVKPEEMQDHASMLSYCYEFLMSAQFRDLNERVRVLIKQHVREREQLAAQGMGTPDAQAANAGANPPGPAGAAGPAPMPEVGMPAGMPAMAEV